MQDLLDKAQGTQCSDIHLITGRPPLFRVLGELRPINYEVLTLETMRGYMALITNHPIEGTQPIKIRRKNWL